MSSAAGRSASRSAAVSSRSSPIRSGTGLAERQVRPRSGRAVAASRSSASRAAGTAANSSPATSASAGPRQQASAARSRRPPAAASPLASASLPARAAPRRRARRPLRAAPRAGSPPSTTRARRRAGPPAGARRAAGTPATGARSRRPPAVHGPEPLDQRTGGDHPPRVQGEQDEQRPHPLPAHVHRPACGIGDLKRAEHAHPNRVRRRDHVAFPDQSQTAAFPPTMLAHSRTRDLSRFWVKSAAWTADSFAKDHPGSRNVIA